MSRLLSAELKPIHSKISGVSGVISLLIESSQNPTSKFRADTYRSVLELLSERLVESADDIAFLVAIAEEADHE
jgi:hypothetical protein